MTTPRRWRLPRLPGSLRMRLLAGTLAWMLLTIALAGWGLRSLFQDHITQQLQAQLVLQLDQLSAAVNLGPAGAVEVAPMAGDPRLARPLSGLYWQVDRLAASAGQPVRNAVARSRSLWDQELPLPAPEGAEAPVASGFRALRLRDGQGHQLLAVTRTLQLPEDDAPPLRLTVAADSALIAEPIQRFTAMLLAALGALAAGLAMAVAVQLQLALRPLNLLRERLAAVRKGDAAQLEGRFPQELQPLVNEFNHVLGVNADMVQRARTQAGNLAHAVHTPLSILGNAAAQEDGPLARLVREQVDTARRQVDYHIARARAAAAIRATGLRTPVLPPLRALVRTMQRLHAGRALDFRLAPGAADGAFRGEEQDLQELLGNLVDNACKWARSTVAVSVDYAAPNGEGTGRLAIFIDDDGPGLTEAEMAAATERGRKLDESKPGSGLGLSIVTDLVAMYSGTFRLSRSPAGGLRAEVDLPAA
ncbi:MAG: sensor histidine kinase [Burkholderiaceae bacterium]|nr:MAG: sensor histidine kinase [Burkholderiaceae bacterium]